MKPSHFVILRENPCDGQLKSMQEDGARWPIRSFLHFWLQEWEELNIKIETTFWRERKSIWNYQRSSMTAEKHGET
jgi:hypothetical protein